MKKHFYFLAWSATLLSGCGKEKMPLVLDGTYELGSTVFTPNPVLLYTKEGRLDNPALLARFLARRSWVNTAMFAHADAPTPYNVPITLLIAGSRATLAFGSSSPTKRDTSRAEIMARTDRSFVLAKVDSVEYTKATYSSRCNDLGEQAVSVRAGKRCRPLPSFTGYSAYCRVRPMQVISLKDNQLFVPQLSCLVSAGSVRYGSCGYSFSQVWNTFDPALITQLIAGDTLVVQEREIALLKK